MTVALKFTRTGDYTALILFSVGITKGKWGTLIESLLAFKSITTMTIWPQMLSRR